MDSVSGLLSNKLVYGGALLSGGVALVAAFTFIRSLLLARGISVEDFGIATALLTSLSLIQMSTAIAVEKQVLQDEEGASQRFLATVHALSILRGAFCGVLMFLSAGPISEFFELQDVLWAFQTVALAPVINGFVHYDFSSMQRESRHAAAVWANTAPEVFITLLLIPAMAIWPDYHAILVVCLGWPFTRLIVSHMVAERPYCVGVNTIQIIRLLKFSWPLMLSGLLLFLIFHGDRAIVGHYFDMKSLGYFSLILTAFLLPSQLLHRIYDSLFLSPLSKSYQQGNGFDLKQSMIWNSLFVLSAGYVWFCILCGPWLFVVLFGEKYQPALDLLPWIVLMVTIRTLRIAPSLLAIATARPVCELYANLSRAIALPLAVTSLLMNQPIESVVIAGIIGETLALVVGFMSLKLPAFRVEGVPFDQRIAALWLMCVALSIVAGSLDFGPALLLPIFTAGLLFLMGICFIHQYSHFNTTRELAGDYL